MDTDIVHGRHTNGTNGRTERPLKHITRESGRKADGAGGTTLLFITTISTEHSQPEQSIWMNVNLRTKGGRRTAEVEERATFINWMLQCPDSHTGGHTGQDTLFTCHTTSPLFVKRIHSANDCHFPHLLVSHRSIRLIVSISAWYDQRESTCIFLVF